MERLFPRKIDSLEEVFGFIRDFGSQHHFNDGLLFYVDFITEEIFTNMVKYNPNGDSGILVQLDHHLPDLVITITDLDSDRFDVSSSHPVDTSQLLDERKVGGLGLYLIQKMADSVAYSYSNRQSKITIKKKLEGINVNG
jgi:serine/threonine-protein kinase RsbW